MDVGIFEINRLKNYWTNFHVVFAKRSMLSGEDLKQSKSFNSPIFTIPKNSIFRYFWHLGNTDEKNPVINIIIVIWVGGQT